MPPSLNSGKYWVMKGADYIRQAEMEMLGTQIELLVRI